MFRTSAVACVTALLMATAPAQPPAPKLDAHGDPLPAGAVARLGSLRRLGQNGTLVPPDFKDVLYVTPAGLARSPVAAPHALIDRPCEPSRLLPWPVVSADGKRAAVLSPKRLVVYDLGTGKSLRSFDLPDDPSTVFVSIWNTSTSFSADGRVLAFTHPKAKGAGRLRVVDLSRGDDPIDIRLAAPGPVRLSPDGKSVATWTFYNPGQPAPPPGLVVKVWNTRDGSERFQAPAGFLGRPAEDVAFSPAGDVMAIGSGGSRVDLWDAAKGKHWQTIVERVGPSKCLAFSPDGTVLAGASADGAVQWWTVADGKHIRTTPPPPSPIPRGWSMPVVHTQNTMRSGPITRNLVLRGSDDGVVWAAQPTDGFIAWEVPGGRVLADSTADGYVADVRFEGKDADVVAVATANGISRWRFPTGAPVTPPVGVRWRYPPLGERYTDTVRFVPDSTRFVLTSPAAAMVFEPGAGSAVSVVPTHTRAGPTGTGVRSSTDGTHVITFSYPTPPGRAGWWSVWNVAAGRIVGRGEIAPGSPPVDGATLSPSGRRLVTISRTDGVRKVEQGAAVTGWDVVTGRVLGQVTDGRMRSGAVVTAVSETTAVLRGTSGALSAVNFVDGELGEQFEQGVMGITSGSMLVPVAVNPTRTRIAAAWNPPRPAGAGVRVYDWPTGRHLREFTGHAGSVTALVFSPDGKYLATGSEDTTVLVWDMSAVR